MSIDKLNEKAKEYSLSEEIIEKRENDRLSFVKQFPLENLKDLSIDQFVQGTDENSFCYWLEFKKIGFGIGGGNASKFGIYKTKNNDYAVGFGKNKSFLEEKEAQDHYKKLLSKIISALEYTEKNQIEAIRTLEIPMWNMVIQKILSIYYPEKFLKIGSHEVLINCAKELQINNIDLIPENSILINYECKRFLRNSPIYKNWPNEKTGTFIWEFFEGEKKKRNGNDSNQYFLVGAYWDGNNPADQTSRFLENGIWENGYDDKFIDAVNVVPVGSKIAIKAVFTREKTKSVMAIKARGTVLENHNDGKTLVVEWDKNFNPFEVDFSGGYWDTIKKVTNNEHIQSIFYNHSNSTNIFELVKAKFHQSIFNNYIDLLRRIIIELKIRANDERIVFSVGDDKLNFIVGQRYCFNLYASYSRGVYGIISKTKLLDDSEAYDGTPPQPYYNFFQDFNPDSSDWGSIMDSIKDELSRTSKSGYRKFKNDDFENYVFSVNADNKTNQMNFPLNTILYGPPGTGKTYNTVLRAAEIIENRKIDSYKEALQIFRTNLHDRIEFITFHQNYSYEDFIQGLRPDTENNNQLTFDRKDGVFKIIADKALQNLKDSDKPQIPKKPFEEVFNQFINPLIEGDVEEIEVKMKKVSYFITSINSTSIDFRKASGGTAHTLSLGTLKKMYSAESILDIQGLSSYYSPLLEILLNAGKDSSGKTEKVERKNYVIIIDEINRANISRVFGELITLIEPDKRSHGKIPMEVKLPSGDTFVVPSNLYLIGTMNTADKSIALLDIALRRRFEFESMYPKYEISGQVIYDVEILKKINEQIIKSKGHDFQIGHAYFMGENKDLVQRMNKKVIPLLLEYYMNDEKEVKGILQSAGLIIEEHSWPIRTTGKND